MTLTKDQYEQWRKTMLENEVFIARLMNRMKDAADLLVKK